MIFKNDWEKTHTQHHISENLIIKMMHLYRPDNRVISHEIIAGGCANLNIKIQLVDNKHPIFLRIYIRDKTSCYREKKIGELLQHTIPAPQIDYIGHADGYTFAITNFIPGISLRDLLLGNQPHDIDKLMHSVGVTLAKISSYTFPKSGFFDKNLHVIECIDCDQYLSFAKICLQSKIVSQQIQPKQIAKINSLLHRHKNLLPDGNDKHLVHADFDPANILVKKQNEYWEISGILDWEFAFSGTVLCDVANMLR